MMTRGNGTDERNVDVDRYPVYSTRYLILKRLYVHKTWTLNYIADVYESCR